MILMLPTQTIVLAAFALSGIAMYRPINCLTSRRFFATRLDPLVPLVPIFVIPYLSFFLFLGAMLVLASVAPWGPESLLAVGVAGWSASVVWYWGRFGVRRPSLPEGAGVMTRAVATIYRFDNVNNAFPSSHVFYSLISSYYLALFFPSFAWVIWIWGSIIAVSTVLVKQHYLPDIAGGIVWATAAIWAAQTILASMPL